MSEIAVASWILGGTLTETLHGFHDLGLTLVELSAGYEPPNPDLRVEAQVEAVRALAGELGLDFYAVHSEFRERWDLAAPDPAQRAFSVAANQAVIRAAARLGARHVVVHPGQELVPDEAVGEQLRRAEESLRRLAPVAREAGVRLAVENLPPGYVGGNREQMAALLEGLDPETFGFCCDTGHAAVAGEGPAAYVRAFAPRLWGIHYHDNGGKDDHLFPGRGRIDWEDFFAALREIGYALPITVEALPPEDMPLAQAAAILRESAAGLRPPRPS
jgi:sugar phosphate isomerase/epimerase